MAISHIVKKIRRELKEKNNIKEKMLANSRRITQLSKESIFLIQSNKPVKAQKRLDAARELLKSTLQTLQFTPELKNNGAFYGATQEYAEAAILLNLEKTGEYPTPELIGTSSEAYILGLADVVGELRRKALESVKNGDIDTAECSYQHMQTIYRELTILNEHVFSILPTLRRKCDVARHLIELTGSEVMMERKRKKLEEYLRLAEKKVFTGEHSTSG